MNYAALIKAINSATTQLQGRAAAAVNQALVMRNWLVGIWIFEYEQNGKDRAKYGVRLLECLGQDLKRNGLKGLDMRTLRDCRAFARCYPQLRGTLSPEFGLLLQDLIRGTVSPELDQEGGHVKRSAGDQKPTTMQPESARRIYEPESEAPPTSLTPEQLLRLSWSHLQELIRIEDPWKRAFFEIECLKGRWSVRQLQRQIDSLLFERTGLSTNKKAVIERARKQETEKTVNDFIRDPYVLEFTGLTERPEYSEDDLESALLDHLQRFLLELGRGFCFEARQFRMTEGRKHHRVDLVFYNRLLRCHVLIDLKVRAFEPADAGQMNFYVNWFKSNMMSEGDNPPVGILLCSDKDRTEVEFATAGMDQHLFVSRYLVALPSVEKLRAFLEADRDHIELHTASAAPDQPRAPKSKQSIRKQ